MMARVATFVPIAVAVVIFTVTLVWWSEFLISDACFDAGGAWDWDTNECRGVEGFEGRQWPITMRFVQLALPAISAAVAGFAAFVAILVVQRRPKALHIGNDA